MALSPSRMTSHQRNYCNSPGILPLRAESLKRQIQLHWAESKTPSRRQFVAPAEKLWLTTLNFDRVAKYRFTTSASNLVSSLLYFKTFSIEVTRYGSMHEDEAKQQYLAYLRTVDHANTSVKDLGLVIDPEDPCLAWSPVAWSTVVQLMKTHKSKRPDSLYDIYVVRIARKTFPFTYDATMSLYNITK